MFIYMRQHILELYRELGLSSVSNTIGISNYLMLPLIDAEAAFEESKKEENELPLPNEGI